jgi:rRNA-processing protein FCF1
MDIVIDTSSIIFGFSNHINIFGIVRSEGMAPMIPECVIRELAGIGNGTGKYAKYARTALSDISGHDGMIIRGSGSDRLGSADSWMLRNAQRRGMGVCTNDTGLRKRLREKNVKVFTLTRKGRLR